MKTRIVPSLLVCHALAAFGAGPDAFEPHVLGGPEPETALAVKQNAYHVTGAGSESYVGADDGTFVSFPTELPTFRFTARIAKAETHTPNPKYGIAIRSGTKSKDRMASIRFDGWEGNECLQWFTRFEANLSPASGARRCYTSGTDKRFSAKEDVWVRIERVYPFVWFYASRDGETWERLPTVSVILDQKLDVGLHVVGGGNGKQPATITFDHVAFEELPSREPPLDRAALGVDWQPEPMDYRMHLARVDNREPGTVFITKPDSMPWKDVRGYFISSGSKEVALRNDPGGLKFESGDGALRRPEGMDAWEGVFDLPPLPAVRDMLAFYGLVRLGGVRIHDDLPENLEALAELTGQEKLNHLPAVATGDSFAGGISAWYAEHRPDRMVATAPVIIGMPEGPVGSGVPRMYIWGGADGNHHGHSLPRSVAARKEGDLSANAPMFALGHSHYNADAIIYPFFIDTLGLRIPKDWDGTSAPDLNPLKQEDGWIGLLGDTSKYRGATDPKIMPFDEWDGSMDPYPMWFPTKRVAHAWRHFVSPTTELRLVYPAFQNAWGYARPEFADSNEVSNLPADRRFHLVAAGPLHEDLELTWFVNGEPVEPAWTDPDNPYHAQHDGLPAGLHVIALEARIGDKVMLSRPASIFFHPEN